MSVTSRIKVAKALQMTCYGEEIIVKGWVRTRRGNKNVSFIALNDGSTINNIQIVVDNANFDENELKKISQSRIFTNAGEYICEKRSLNIDFITDKIENAVNKTILTKEKGLCTQIASLDALSPSKTLLRGYTSVESEGESITSVKKLSVNDNITVRFHDGSANCSVNKID